MLTEPQSAKRGRDWFLFAAWSLVIFSTIPIARAIQGYVDDRWGRELFRYLVIAVVCGSTALALVSIRRAGTKLRLPNVAALLAVAAAYVFFAYRLCQVADEAVHFAEYGVLGLLSFRAFAHRNRNYLVYVCALLLCIIVGTVDEMLQWLTPGRYFDFRDVQINALGAALALAGIAWGLSPAWLGDPVRARSVRTAARLAIGGVLLVGCCFANTPTVVYRYASVIPGLRGLAYNRSTMSQFGYRYEDPDIGTFKSRFTPEALAHTDQQRGAEAAAILDTYYDPNEALTRKRYLAFLGVYTPGSDPFLHELRVHLRSRDENVRRARVGTPGSRAFVEATGRAYGEHLITLRYFSNSVARSRYHLTEEQGAALKARASPGYVFVSRVSENLSTDVSPLQVAAILGLLLAGLVAVDLKYGHE